MAAGCGRSPKRDREEVNLDATAPIPEEVAAVIEAVSTDDAAAFAQNVDYPLPRPYPLKDIESPEEMRDYFPIMVDDSLRNIVARARRTDWTEAGWRGWTLDAGQYIWIDRKVYLVPYISRAEKALLETAIDRDLATLPREFRTGWRPVMAFGDKNSPRVFRLDENDDNRTYRILEYKNAGERRIGPSDLPSKIYLGEMTTEGTEQNRMYGLKSSSGDSMLLQPDDTGEGMDMKITSPTGKEEHPDVSRIYWTE